MPLSLEIFARVVRLLAHSEDIVPYGRVVGNAQRRAVEAHEARVEKYAVQ